MFHNSCPWETTKILCGQLLVKTLASCTLNIKLSTKNLRCFSTAIATENDVISCQWTLDTIHTLPHSHAHSSSNTETLGMGLGKRLSHTDVPIHPKFKFNTTTWHGRLGTTHTHSVSKKIYLPFTQQSQEKQTERLSCWFSLDTSFHRY